MKKCDEYLQQMGEKIHFGIKARHKKLSIYQQVCKATVLLCLNSNNYCRAMEEFLDCIDNEGDLIYPRSLSMQEFTSYRSLVVLFLLNLGAFNKIDCNE